MSASTEVLRGTLIARILSDDLYGDIPGRRLAIASSIALLSEQEAEAALCKLWVLNRLRDEELLNEYRKALRCFDSAEMELRGERVIAYSSERNNTHVIELPFRQEELDACPDAESARLYLANPNVARNVALAFGAACGTSRIFVLDGDIYIPRLTFGQIGRLLEAHGPDCAIWLFTMRAWSLEEFEAEFSTEASGRIVVDTCENEFILNSWPPKVIRLGDEGMLGLPAGAEYFDERYEYGRDPKVAYCAMLRAGGRRLLTPSYPVCHLEHRNQPAVPAALDAAQREQWLLQYRMSVRESALKELLGWWHPASVESCK